MTATRIFFAALTSLLFVVGSAQATLIGPVLLPTYDNAADGANNVFTVYSAFPFPTNGSVDYLQSNVQLGSNGAGGVFAAMQLRPVGSNYQVIASQTFTAPAGANPGYHYNLTTPWTINAGDLYADFGTGVPFNFLPKLGDPNPVSPIYFTPSHQPIVGETITLNSVDFPLYPQDRGYGLAANFAPEPSSFVLGGLGVVGLLVVARRRRQA